MPIATADRYAVTAQPHSGERRCSCGCILRRGHDGDHCECCERRRLAYKPQHDPHFADALLALLKANPGQAVNVYRALEITHCGMAGWKCVQNHIERFRRNSHAIIGRHDGTYTYVGESADAAGIRRRA